MTDRELLEMAAKAAGIEWIPSDTEKGRECELKFGLWLRIDGEPTCPRRRWNPLTDDGDALRLAVKMRISLIHESEYMNGPVLETIEAITPSIGKLRHVETASLNALTDDEMENTRRAIVRAAAAIGESL